MRFAAFTVDDYEVEGFSTLSKKYGIEFDYYKDELENIGDDVDLSVYDGISLIGMGNIPNSFIDRLSNCKVIGLRSIGFQYLDIEYCKKKGIVVTNASYDPYNVADFTVMLMLLSLRKTKVSICKALVNDFSLDGMCGSEMRNKVVGIIGTGKIGRTVIKELSGFGCKIYCNDIYENEEVKQYAEYKSLDCIIENCDIISFHTPLTKDNYHIISDREIEKMKKGVIIINTARGGLLDTEALIRGIESLRIGALALDTIEGEDGIAHVDMGNHVDGLPAKKNIMYLKQFPNVLLTQHYAFFTEEAVHSMIECSIKAIYSMINNKPYINRIN